MKEFWRLWWVSLAVKLLVAFIMPLGADEAYYWVWSHRISLSYFDHPPMVAWLFYIGHFLEPLGHAVRWPAVLLGHGILVVWYFLLRGRVDSEKIRIWIYLALFSPLLGFGSLIITPDLPVLFFWSLALLFGVKALEEKKLGDYALFGATLGLGFCSKYHIVLFLPCFLAYITFEKKWSDVKPKGIALVLLTGLLFSTPVVLWNVLNDFASFEFQLKHGLEKTVYESEWTVTYVTAQILLIFPLVLWSAVRAQIPTQMRWIPYFTWIPLGFFFLTSFRALVEANWPIIAYPALYAAAIFFPKMKSWLKYYILFWATLTAIVVSSLVIPSVRNITEKIREPYDFIFLTEELQNYRPLFANTYQTASSIWYFSKIPTFKLKGMSRYDYFDTLNESLPTTDSFYVIKRDYDGLPLWVSEQQWLVKRIKTFAPNFELLEITKQ